MRFLDALAAVQWTWPAPHELCDTRGQRWNLLLAEDTGALKQAFRDGLRRQAWRLAPEGSRYRRKKRGGQENLRESRDLDGVEQGVDRDRTLAWLRDAKPVDAGHLRVLLCGGVYARERLWRQGIPSRALAPKRCECAHCPGKLATRWHHYWECQYPELVAGAPPWRDAICQLCTQEPPLVPRCLS